jgi:hypothetical protein
MKTSKPLLGPEQAQTLRVPKFRFDFPVRLHPSHAQFDDQVLAWMARHRLLGGERPRHADRGHRPAPGRLVGRLFPHGNTEVVLLAAQMAVWAELLDDEFTDPAVRTHDLAGMADRLLTVDSILHCPDITTGMPDEPSESALRDLCLRIRTMATPQQFLRIQRGVLRACLGFTADAAHASGNDLPTVAQYRSIRRNTSTLDIFMVLAELGAGFEIPPAESLRPEVNALADATVSLFATTHDILTCHKDVYHGDRLNLAILLAAEHCRTVQEGLALATEELHDGTVRFQQCAERLLDFSHHASWAHRLIFTLEHILGGYLAWLSEIWLTELGNYSFGGPLGTQ